MNNDMNAELSIDTEGNVIKCAKNAASSECGFKPGADICAKCGAMPVTMKMVPVDVDDDDFADILEKAAAMGAMEAEDMPDETMMADEEMLPRKRKRHGYGYAYGR